MAQSKLNQRSSRASATSVAVPTSRKGNLAHSSLSSKRSTAKPATKAVARKAKTPVRRPTNEAPTRVQRGSTPTVETSPLPNLTDSKSSPSTKFITQQPCAIPVYMHGTGPVIDPEKDYGDLATSSLFHAASLLSWFSSVPSSTGSAMDALGGQLKAQDMLKPGNIEAMLYCQAVALQAIFSKIAQNAATQPTFRQQEASLRLAFKAQAQSRATLEALNEVKNPRAVVFAKQYNNAQGHQQVNNGTNPSTASPDIAHGKSETTIQPNELLEAPKHGDWMDTGTTGKSIEGDQALAAVAAVHRAPES